MQHHLRSKLVEHGGQSSAIANVAAEIAHAFAEPEDLKVRWIRGNVDRKARDVSAKTREPSRQPGSFKARVPGDEHPPSRKNAAECHRGSGVPAHGAFPVRHSSFRAS